MFTVVLNANLPDSIDSPANAAGAEGFGIVARLAADYRSGRNRFTGRGEALWTARATGELIGVWRVTTSRS